MTPDAAGTLAGLGDVVVPRLSGIELPEEAPAARGRDLHDDADAAADEIAEPVYDQDATDDIQGNVVPGFNKDHQQFLFLSFTDAERARGWLRWLAPRLSSTSEVLDFRREFRAERLRTGAVQPSRRATWTAFALSHHGVRALLGEEVADEFGDQSFRQGLAARSTYLGDPTDPGRAGHRQGWHVGGPGNEADALVIVAADSGEDLGAAVDEVREAASDHGVTVIFEQRCANLPGNLAGHEHFGFKDGVSQPGIRGRVEATGAPITPRFLDPASPEAQLFARPGQPLVWPGQFLLGEPRQDPADPKVPADPASGFPAWAARGSYLVCRRLDQDVAGFWELVATEAAKAGTTPARFASLLVGRWPSGAPLPRAPEADDPDLAGDEFANNHFLFDDDTADSPLGQELLDSGYAGDHHRSARADVLGRVCPHASHIRKVNPRDSGTDFGAPGDTFLRLMLRRGIPYGEPLAGVADPSPELVAAARGLMFVAYMSSIEDQFEFVSRRWANSTVQPNAGGHDPVIGQRDRSGDRTRQVDVPVGDTAAHRAPGAPDDQHRVTLPEDFVVPTGGGYFFAPPISAVAGILAGNG